MTDPDCRDDISMPPGEGAADQSTAKTFDCDCVLGQVEYERYVYNVLVLPAHLADGPLFRGKPRVRIRGVINGQHPLDAAFQNLGGRKVAILGKRALKSMALKAGDVIRLSAELADPDRVDVPADLQLALADQQALYEVWQDLTAGKRRGLCYRVDSAKKPETRARRIAEVLEELRRWDFSS